MKINAAVLFEVNTPFQIDDPRSGPAPGRRSPGKTRRRPGSVTATGIWSPVRPGTRCRSSPGTKAPGRLQRLGRVSPASSQAITWRSTGRRTAGLFLLSERPAQPVRHICRPDLGRDHAGWDAAPVAGWAAGVPLQRAGLLCRVHRGPPGKLRPPAGRRSAAGSCADRLRGHHRGRCGAQHRAPAAWGKRGRVRRWGRRAQR